MILLLDAHTVLWWLSDDPTLSTVARVAIADPTNDALVSAATVWKIAIKRALGKLEAPEALTEALREVGFDVLPISGDDAEQAGALPPHHRDPFDRMLVAQGSRLGARIVTRDAAFAAYDAAVLRA